MSPHRRRRARLAAASVVAILTLAGCGNDTPSAGDGGDPPSGTVPAVARPSTNAVLSIVEPSNGDELPGGDVAVALELDGAEVVAQTSTDLRADQGHLHVLLDDALISMTDGLEQTIADVAPGQHVLKVEFVANDHAPFDPRVIEAVTFEVRGS